MRRFINGLAVLSLVTALTSSTAYAADRRDDTGWSPIKRIVQIIKRVVKGLDDIGMSYPKP
jgi:hypothetical protein